jgi:hypothetical protein
MNQKIVKLINDIRDLSFEDKVKRVESYINSERQQAYYQAQYKIMKSFTTIKNNKYGIR